MLIEKVCYPKEIPIGSLLNEDLFTTNGALLCPKMTLIDDVVHSKLERYQGTVRVLVTEQEKTVNDLSNDIVSDLDDSLDFTEEIKEQAEESVVSIFDNLDKPEEAVDITQMLSKQLCDYIKSSKDVGINLEKLKISDEYTFKHSVDVGTMASLLSVQLGKSEKFVQDIMIAGILHDIGKSKIPPEILNKPGKLTDKEFRIIQNHPVFSYQILRDCRNVSEEIRQAVINHHENIDGSGYPRKLFADSIGEMAKIIAISDVFDALVTKRVYKPAKTPAQAIEMMFSMGNKFDIRIFRMFLSQVNAYPNGSVVTLSNNQVCKVVAQNNDYPLRPIVMDLTTKNIVDLSTNMDYLSVTIIT